MSDPTRPTLRLSRRATARLVHGHPWIFAGETGRGGPVLEPGDVADVTDPGGAPLASVYVNPHALILARVIGPPGTTPDAAWLRDRVRRAIALRTRLLDTDRFARLVFSESDGLPGVIVDRYGDVLVLQLLTVGAERWRQALVDILVTETGAAHVLLANDSPFRGMEGLPAERVVVEGDPPPVVWIEESGATFGVNVRGGQKTGFFFDQRDNRRRVVSFLRGGRVLDLFCYTGAFGVLAARAGAEVVGRDRSEPAIALARDNAERNGVGERCRFEIADVIHDPPPPPGDPFDVVILDPPPLARNRKSRAAAERALTRLVRDALAQLRPGGLLVACSCSHHLGRAALAACVGTAGARAGRDIQTVAWGGQALDHPTLPSCPETEYLHALFAVVS